MSLNIQYKNQYKMINAHPGYYVLDWIKEDEPRTVDIEIWKKPIIAWMVEWIIPDLPHQDDLDPAALAPIPVTLDGSNNEGNGSYILCPDGTIDHPYDRCFQTLDDFKLYIEELVSKAQND